MHLIFAFKSKTVINGKYIPSGLLWHEYKYCTKCPSEVFRIAQFCTYFLKNFLGEEPQTPLLLVLSKDLF